MNWLGVAFLVLKLADALMGYLSQQKLIGEATAAIVQLHLAGALDEVKRAQAERDAVRQSFDPGKLPDSDPNLRD